ncbi:unnamed protein product [Malus baccata var. baccata]
MSSVVFLLANKGARLPWPEQPGFFMERCSTDLDTRTRGEQSHTQNEISPTVEVCIQKLLEDRPAISSMLLMLSNEEPTLPQPKEPGLFVKGSSMGIDPLMGEGRSHTRNTIILSTMDKRVVLISVISAVSVLLFLGFTCFLSLIIQKKRRKKSGSTSPKDLELPLFDFEEIATATNNFSFRNKLGEGGFGPVYKRISSCRSQSQSFGTCK